MNTSAIEILAAILIGVVVLKLAVVLVNVQGWIALAKTVYAKPIATSAVSYLLASLVLYVLLTSGLTIVQVLAVCLFVVLLIVPGFAPYAHRLLGCFDNKSLGDILKEQWLYMAVWMILLGWGAYELLSPRLVMASAQDLTRLVGGAP